MSSSAEAIDRHCRSVARCSSWTRARQPIGIIIIRASVTRVSLRQHDQRPCSTDGRRPAVAVVVLSIVRRHRIRRIHGVSVLPGTRVIFVRTDRVSKATQKRPTRLSSWRRLIGDNRVRHRAAAGPPARGSTARGGIIADRAVVRASTRLQQN